jgi:hypothetical protein
VTLQSIQQFPITVWPPGQISAVPVERWAVRTGDGGNLDWYPAIEPRELPDEWVLRQLADVDLEDDHAVATLLGDFGVISRPYFDPTGGSGRPAVKTRSTERRPARRLVGTTR